MSVRVLAIDLGQRRIGLAKSDLMRVIAQPLCILIRPKRDELLMAEIKKICEQEEVSDIVIGLPFHMNGDESKGTEQARAFKSALESALNMPVHLWDERLSTVAATRLMTALETPTEQRKGKVDQLAAVMILDGYLRYLESQNKNHSSDT